MSKGEGLRHIHYVVGYKTGNSKGTRHILTLVITLAGQVQVICAGGIQADGQGTRYDPK